MTKQRIRIFTVPKKQEIPIRNVTSPTHQGGFLQMVGGEIIFRLSFKGGLKMEQMKLNIDLKGANMSITAEPGFVYVTARTKESAVHKFLNSISDAAAVKLAKDNGFELDELNFPEPEIKNPDAENPHPETNVQTQTDHDIP